MAMHGRKLLEMKATKEQEMQTEILNKFKFRGQNAKKLEDDSYGAVTFHCAKINDNLLVTRTVSINDPPRVQHEDLEKATFEDLDTWSKGGCERI